MKYNHEINKIDEDFRAWDDALNNIDYLPLEDAYLLMKKALIYFPNILFSDMPYPMIVYRARIISKDSSEDISVPKTFSYPPADKAKHYQRASVPGFPVFYGTMDAKTAIEELRTNSIEPIKKGDHFYLSEWKINPDVLCTFNCLTFSKVIGDGFLMGGMTERVNFSLETILKDTPADFRDTQIHLYNKLGHLFLNGKYLQSGPIAYKILFDGPGNEKMPDGIIYPSCSNNYESVNCAVHPDFVDRNMKMQVVRKLSFEEFTEHNAHSLMHYFGEVENGKVIWKNYITEMHGKYTMTFNMSTLWSEKDMDEAAFFVGSAQMDSTKFCEGLIDAIDFDNLSLPQPKEISNKPEEPLEFVFTYPLTEQDCYFKGKLGINKVSGLKITIPSIRKINIVSANEVIQA